MPNFIHNRHIAASGIAAPGTATTPGPAVLRAFDLPSFVQMVQTAQACFPLSDVPIEVELAGRWFSYVPSLHRACTTHLQLNRANLRVAFTPEAMQADDQLFDQLGHARQATLELLGLIEEEQEQVKARMVERTGQLIDATEKRLADPETLPQVARSLRNTFREPTAILAENQGARQAKGRVTQSVNEKVQSLSEENRRLRLEQKVLKGEQLTLEDLDSTASTGRTAAKASAASAASAANTGGTERPAGRSRRRSGR